MTLNDIFDQLIYGELRQVFVDNEINPVTELPKEKRVPLFNSIKLGLTDLHKRLLLREKRFKLVPVPGRQSYLLDSRFAVSNTRSTEAVKYIDDTFDPFANDLLLVERVVDCHGKEFPLNDLGKKNSVRTTSYNSLLLPDEVGDSAITVIYRADHPPVAEHLVAAAPQLVPIELSSTYLQALLYYVASRVQNPLSMTDEFHEGNNYMAKYEAEVAGFVNKGLYTHSHDSCGDTRFSRDGWC